MAEQLFDTTYDGQEFQLGDADVVALGALMDDRVFAEILRLAPYNGVLYSKAVLPYGILTTPGSGASSAYATVAPTYSANGSVAIGAFRMFVGSRNTPTAAANPDFYQPSNPALSNWRDIRSGIFLGSTIALQPNTSGNPRWDLIYAAITPDQPQSSVQRRVKDPNTGVISIVNVPPYYLSPVGVSVVTGTAAATPALPTLPADSASAYYVPLAYVRVPNGFGATTTVETQDIRATQSGANSLFHNIRSGGPKFRPCRGNNDGNTAGSGNTNIFNVSSSAQYYNPATAGQRSPAFLPPDMVGGESFIGEIDVSNGSSSNWSHVAGSVVDDTIDWRGRFILCNVSISSSNKLASDPTAGTTANPCAGVPASSPCQQQLQMGNSCQYDATFGSGKATVFCATSASMSNIASGSEIGLYVDSSTGALRFYVNATAPLVTVAFMILASGQLLNQ